MTDPIADFLTRVRNASLAHQTHTTAPYSKLKEQLAKILQRAGYLEKVAVGNTSHPKYLQLTLKYQGKYAVISGLERLSTPGRRLYVQATNIKPVLSGQGLTVLSTPKGLMTNVDARNARLGGELICKVW